MIFEHGDRIVFAGDSVTDCGRKRPYGEGLWECVGNCYVRQVDSALSVLYPEKLIHITNVGCSGATSADMLRDWENNVEKCNPDYVFVMIGANDVWRQFDEPAFDHTERFPEAYRANLEAVCERTMPKVKGMFIISPFYMEANEGDPMKKRTVEYAQICKEVAAKYGARIDRVKFHATVAEADIAGKRVLLMKPTTYMNNSGVAVAEAASFYKIPAENVIVLHDEISFDPGVIRIRRKGSAGGHNGLKSIIAHLGSDAFPRIKIGVGQKPSPDYDLAAFVLGKFTAEQIGKINEKCPDIIASAALMLDGKIDEAMNRYSK